MVDQRRRATEANVERRRISLDQRAIALRNAPVDVGVAIARVFGDDELIRLDAVDVGHHRAEQPVPAAARLEEIRHRPRAAFRGRLVDARIEAIPCGVIVRALALRKNSPGAPAGPMAAAAGRPQSRARARARPIRSRRPNAARSRRDRARCCRNDRSRRARRPGRALPAPRRNAAQPAARPAATPAAPAPITTTSISSMRKCPARSVAPYLGEHFAQVCQQFLHLADVTRRFSWIRAVNRNCVALVSVVLRWG